ncbi:de-etiolated protein 1 det1 domain-containing protein [Ditylenchus destructor]|nr:de-etiolated protein 1 det1 domain-containing protein [Ditylenchus destructor]
MTEKRRVEQLGSNVLCTEVDTAANTSSNMPPEKYSKEWCNRRKYPTAHVVKLLRKREIGHRREGSHFVNGSREFYYSVPMLTSRHILNRPHFYPLRFSPDGSKLVGLSLNLQEVFVYNYCGIQSAAGVSDENLFSAVFGERHTVTFFGSPNQSERLVLGSISRDCCLITPDSRHMIVCSSMIVSENNSRIAGGVIKNNESIPPNSSNLEDIAFYSIDMKKCHAVDRVKFDFDYVNISQGVYLMDRILAILSIQHQTVHLFQIDRISGLFIPLLQIGRSILDDDRLYALPGDNPITEAFFTGFRQRFLTFVYKEHSRRNETVSFLRNIAFFKALKMNKIQLIGSDFLLIRMDASETRFDQYSTNYMFTLMDWRKGTIIGVYDRSSVLLFNAFERFNESFRAGGVSENPFPITMEHCGYVRDTHEFIKQSTMQSFSANNTRRRFLSALPYSVTGVPIVSPYLDPHMFSIDDRALIALEKGRFPLEQLFNRKTNLLHVQLDFQPTEENQGFSRQNPFARVLFHPFDPFAMSFNKNQPDILTAFHLPDIGRKDL